MSTDYTAVCDKCKVYRHLGQSMGGLYTFGYGSKDITGAQLASMFIADHIYCDQPRSATMRDAEGIGEDMIIHMGGMRIVLTDHIPPEYANAASTEDRGRVTELNADFDK